MFAMIRPKGGKTMANDTQILLGQLWAIATARPTEMMKIQNGVLEIRDTAELSEEQKAAIASIEKSTSGVKVKFYDKLKALELLGKMMGLFDSRPQKDSQTNLLDTILAATGEEVSVHDLPEVQQTADDRHDLVESAEPETL